jgi:ArsR family transcriptional regulator
MAQSMENQSIEYIAAIMKTLGDENRLYIFSLLTKQELCVCEITAISHLSQSNVSQHLAKLRSAGIVKERKDAQWVYYSINNSKNPVINEIIKLLPDPGVDISKLKTLRSHSTCKF